MNRRMIYIVGGVFVGWVASFLRPVIMPFRQVLIQIIPATVRYSRNNQAS